MLIKLWSGRSVWKPSSHNTGRTRNRKALSGVHSHATTERRSSFKCLLFEAFFLWPSHSAEVFRFWLRRLKSLSFGLVHRLKCCVFFTDRFESSKTITAFRSLWSKCTLAGLEIGCGWLLRSCCFCFWLKMLLSTTSFECGRVWEHRLYSSSVGV